MNEARISGALPTMLANAVSGAITAALERGMEMDEACCVAVAVIADYARFAYGAGYLDELAFVLRERANAPQAVSRP